MTDAQAKYHSMLVNFMLSKKPIDYTYFMSLIPDIIDINYPCSYKHTHVIEYLTSEIRQLPDSIVDAVYFFLSCGVSLEIYSNIDSTHLNNRPIMNSLHYFLFTQDTHLFSGPLVRLIGSGSRLEPSSYTLLEDILGIIKDVNLCAPIVSPTVLQYCILSSNFDAMKLVIKHPSVDPNHKGVLVSPIELSVMVLLKLINISSQWIESDQEEIDMFFLHLSYTPPPEPVNPPPVPPGIMKEDKPYCPRALSLERSNAFVQNTYIKEQTLIKIDNMVKIIKELFSVTGKRPNLGRLYYLYKDLQTIKSFQSFQLVEEKMNSGAIRHLEELLDGIFTSPVQEEQSSPVQVKSMEEKEEPLLIRMLNGEYFQIDNKEFKGKSFTYLYKHIAEQINQFEQDSRVYYWQLNLINKDGVRHKMRQINELQDETELSLFISKIYMP